MNWRHIMDEQPKHDEVIIQIDPPYEGNYTMGMRTYYQQCTWEEMLEYCKHAEIPNPNFWWMPAKEFPFPKMEEQRIPFSKNGRTMTWVVTKKIEEIPYCWVNISAFAMLAISETMMDVCYVEGLCIITGKWEQIKRFENRREAEIWCSQNIPSIYDIQEVSRMNWIKCGDRLPPTRERVLISSDEGIHTGYWDGYSTEFPSWQIDLTGSYASDGCVFDVKWWMPLPEPAEEE